MAEENSTGVESESQVTDQAETNGDFEIEKYQYSGKCDLYWSGRVSWLQ